MPQTVDRADAEDAASFGLRPAARAPGRGARLLRTAFKGALITGSSMVLAACYGCPPDGCGSLDQIGGASGSGASGNVNTGGGFATGGSFATGGAGSGASGPVGGNAGEGGMGGLGDDLGGGAP